MSTAKTTKFEHLLRNESRYYEPSIIQESDEPADDNEVTPTVSKFERLLRNDPEIWGRR